MITPSEARAIGHENAATAIDQAASYDGIEDAVDSYGQNAGDTLMELGVKDGDPVIDEMHRAFLDKLRAHGIEHKPHGM